MHFNLLQAGSIAAALVILPLAYALPASILELTPRELLQTAVQGLPACNTEETDPTWAKNRSAWKDGEGHLMGDNCDNLLGEPNRCW